VLLDGLYEVERVATVPIRNNFSCGCVVLAYGSPTIGTHNWKQEEADAQRISEARRLHEGWVSASAPADQ
jgi:hypothetical protein